MYSLRNTYFRITNTSKLAILLRHSVLFSQSFRTCFNKSREDKHLERTKTQDTSHLYYCSQDHFIKLLTEGEKLPYLLSGNKTAPIASTLSPSLSYLAKRAGADSQARYSKCPLE